MEFKEAPYDEALGKCKFCQANNVRNPKTGKVFCSAKCWLNKSSDQGKAPYTPEQGKSAEIDKFQKNKEASMVIMSSGRDAVLLTIAEMAQGNAWSEEDIQKRIETWKGYLSTKIYVDKPF